MIHNGSASQAEMARAEPFPSNALPRRCPVIQVLDDDDAICRLIAHLLAPEGYVLESAGPAIERLHRAQEPAPATAARPLIAGAAAAAERDELNWAL